MLPQSKPYRYSLLSPIIFPFLFFSTSLLFFFSFSLSPLSPLYLYLSLAIFSLSLLSFFAKNMILGVLYRQAKSILIDSYANAFIDTYMNITSPWSGMFKEIHLMK